MQLPSKHSHYGIKATWRNDRLWVDTLPTPITAFSYKEKNATQQALSMILVSNPISLNGCPWALRSLACPFKDYTRLSLRLKQRGLVREGRSEPMNAGVTEQLRGWVRDHLLLLWAPVSSRVWQALARRWPQKPSRRSRNFHYHSNLSAETLSRQANG